MPRSSIALSNLRGVVIVIVLAFHSVLAYLSYLPQASYAFDTPPYKWQAVPIIDSHRWFGFDLFCAWQDVSLMSLMFFLSGLFVPASLARKGSRTFLSDRLLRIGMPLAVVVALLMPVAYYPSYYLTTATDPSIIAFWRHWLALPFWPVGPQWFLWELLALNVIAAGLFIVAPRWHVGFNRLSASARAHPTRFFAVLVAASALAYVPLELIYSPWTWFNFGPFSFQYCRPLHYLVYFAAGYIVGAQGLDRGLLATDGALARHWGRWLTAAMAGFALWALPTSQMLNGQQAPIAVQIASGIGYAVACAAGSFFFLAVCLRFATEHNRTLASLSANAYSMYLLHYVFVVWLQYAVLGLALFAIGKAAIVFGGTLAIAWGLSVALGNIAPSTLFAQGKRWAGISLGGPAPAKIFKQDDLTR
jgi:peptidoglycan/LPS O-acetylase OafA/YrhL